MATSSTLPAEPEAAPVPTAAERGGGGPLVTLCFAAATFLGAFLLFLVQPLIAKYVLPWFGGGAAVWASCLLFFQGALLAGYLYAHLGVRRLPRGAQAVLHAVVLAVAALAALPSITPSARWQPPPGDANPTWRIVLLLAVTVGLPCVALAATSPLLHAWYARIRPGTAVYRLYALSNVGSLLALLAYPLVVERFLTRATQAQVWSIGLAAFAVLCGACALIAWRYRAIGESPQAMDTDTAVAAPAASPGVRGVLWLALSACGSALLLGTTNTITQDFAPIPLLWVIPLALYLLTFIVAFDRPRWYVRPVWNVLLAACVVGTLGLLFNVDDVESLPLIVGTLATTMFVACMVLHGELARLRPPSAQLTSYYLTIAAGGALGGLLVAVGAPLLLRSYFEFPAALWACCLLAFLTPHLAARRMPEGFVGIAAIAGIMGIAPLLWVVSHRALVGGKLIERSRDFYGGLSVWAQTADDNGQPLEPGRVLHHGSITHGHQYDDRPDVPTTYYYPETGAGRVLGDDSPLPDGPRRVAVVGLGTGSLAAYARPGDAYRFYEISPNVARVARTHFTYLADLEQRGATADIALGDARLSLERESDGVTYDAIVLDAFSGDAIPVHLLTSEAFDLYRRRLAPGGLLAVHVSNKYLDLKAVVAAAARRLGWAAYHVESSGDDDDMNYPADWVVLGPDPARVGALHLPESDSLKDVAPMFVPWTDEWANVMGVMD